MITSHLGRSLGRNIWLDLAAVQNDPSALQESKKDFGPLIFFLHLVEGICLVKVNSVSHQYGVSKHQRSNWRNQGPPSCLMLWAGYLQYTEEWTHNQKIYNCWKSHQNSVILVVFQLSTYVDMFFSLVFIAVMVTLTHLGLLLFKACCSYWFRHLVDNGSRSVEDRRESWTNNECGYWRYSNWWFYQRVASFGSEGIVFLFAYEVVAFLHFKW